MTDGYEQALQAARALLAEWQELIQTRAQRLASGDPKIVLDTLTREQSLPARLSAAIRAAASSAHSWYAELAAQEEAVLADYDAKIQPIVAELRRLQAQLDTLLREKRAHEHRWQALRSWAEDARKLTALQPSRVREPQDAERLLAQLPPAEEPPLPEPPRVWSEAEVTKVTP